MGCCPGRRVPPHSMVVGAPLSPGPPCESSPSPATVERCSCSPLLHSIEGPVNSSISLGPPVCCAVPGGFGGSARVR
eukprot:291498-Prorocentrum_lima.AAC.1